LSFFPSPLTPFANYSFYFSPSSSPPFYPLHSHIPLLYSSTPSSTYILPPTLIHPTTFRLVFRHPANLTPLPRPHPLLPPPPLLSSQFTPFYKHLFFFFSRPGTSIIETAARLLHLNHQSTPCLFPFQPRQEGSCILPPCFPSPPRSKQVCLWAVFLMDYYGPQDRSSISVIQAVSRQAICMAFLYCCRCPPAIPSKSIPFPVMFQGLYTYTASIRGCPTPFPARSTPLRVNKFVRIIFPVGLCCGFTVQTFFFHQFMHPQFLIDSPRASFPPCGGVPPPPRNFPLWTLLKDIRFLPT